MMEVYFKYNSHHQNPWRVERVCGPCTLSISKAVAVRYRRPFLFSNPTSCIILVFMNGFEWDEVRWRGRARNIWAPSLSWYLLEQIYLCPLNGFKSTSTHERQCWSVGRWKTEENSSVDLLIVSGLGWCPKRFLGIVGRDSSVSESNRLHVDVFWFFLR